MRTNNNEILTTTFGEGGGDSYEIGFIKTSIRVALGISEGELNKRFPTELDLRQQAYILGIQSNVTDATLE